MTPKTKLWLSIGGLLAVGFLLPRRRPVDDPGSAAGICVEGATGPMACGGDIPVTPGNLWDVIWGAVGPKPSEQTPPTWNGDPDR